MKTLALALISIAVAGCASVFDRPCPRCDAMTADYMTQMNSPQMRAAIEDAKDLNRQKGIKQ